MSPKVSINDRFYKVFGTRFWDGAKHCFTNAFPRFPETGKPHLVLLINVMVFGYFLRANRENGSKSINKRQVL